MSTDRCDHWRGMLAMEVVGLLEESDAAELEAHLRSCAACRDERAELLPLGPALAAADPARADPEAELPAGLGDAVLGRLHLEARRDARRRLSHRVLLAAAAVVVLAAGVVAGLQPWRGTTGRTVAMSGPPGVQATVTLVPEAWGTRLVLEESGQPAGQVLTVSMRNRAGRWWDAGSYRTVAGRAVRVELACAVPASDVYVVYVRDAGGRTVLRSEAAEPA